MENIPADATPERLIADAVAAIEAGRSDLAEMFLRRVITLRPGDAPALSILGLVLHDAGRHGEAEQAFIDLIQAQPDEPAHWMNLGTARRALGNPEGALTAFTRAAQLGAASPDFYYNVGLTHIDRKDFEAARAVLEIAVSLAPQDAEVRLQYATACHESLQTELGIAALADWQSFPGLYPELLARIGNLLMNMGETARAEEAMRAALPGSTGDAQASATLVKMLERTNRLDEARELLDNVKPSEVNTGDEGALALARATLAQRDGDHALAVELYRQALEQVHSADRRQNQLFPLAKSLDALGRYDEAHDALQQAHRAQLEHVNLVHPLLAVRGSPSLIITEFSTDPEDVATWSDEGAPSTEQSPIFIVAFPRSGTTLLEVTLDAHPLLQSMDEQPFLQNALQDLSSFGVRYPAQLGQLKPEQLESVREAYWQRVRSKANLAPGQRLVDKNPLNLLRLPVIRRLFPRSRVIVAVRHPFDVLLSCYMQHFRAPEFALLCKDLPSIAQGYRASFDFWYQQAAILAPQALEVRYESFVASFESGVREIVDFLQLPWDDALLAPANRAREKRYISTPSYSQVVQPVSSKSVGRWRHYERYLKPLAPVVQPYLDRWGYEA
jgi:tetratricopeptide (TPR) repeat protein